MYYKLFILAAGFFVAACGAAGPSVEEQRATTDRVRGQAGKAWSQMDEPSSPKPARSDAGAKSTGDRQAEPAAAVAPPAEYPADRFLVGFGESNRGSAEAESIARAEVSNQVQSTMKSEIKILAGQEGGRDYEEIAEKIVQTSEFAHAEMIRIDRARGGCGGDGKCRAMAFLERTPVAEVLLAEYRRGAEVFRAAAASAKADEADLVAFSTAFRHAEDAYRPILPLALQVRAITGQPPAEVAADEALFLQILAARPRVLGKQRLVVIRPAGLEAEVWESLGNALAGAFTRLGLATSTGNTCTGTLGFAVQASLACSRSYFGPRCALETSGKLSYCATGSEIAPVDLSSARTKAACAHPRDDSVARRCAVEKATAEALVPLLREQLGRLLPLR